MTYRSSPRHQKVIRVYVTSELEVALQMRHKPAQMSRKRSVATAPRPRGTQLPRREVDRDSLDRFEGEGGNQEQFGEKERHDAPAPGRPARDNTPPPA
jgi:hypothetical protein